MTTLRIVWFYLSDAVVKLAVAIFLVFAVIVCFFLAIYDIITGKDEDHNPDCYEKRRN